MSFYIGRRRRTRDVLQRHMYISEISQWLREAQDEERALGINLVDEAHINSSLMEAEA